MRIEVRSGGISVKINTHDTNLLRILAKHGIYLNAYCAGRGICKKCTIRYLSTPPEATEIEKRRFCDEELSKGYRLACLHEARDGDIIEVTATKVVYAKEKIEPCVDSDASYLIFDIGTTTIVGSCIKGRKATITARMLNPQVAFGADVMSRLTYLQDHGDRSIYTVLQKSVREMAENLMKNFSGEKPALIVAVANPTMLSFLLNLDPSGISQYPYEAPFKGPLLTQWNGIPLYVPPVVSAFVGSDITAGLMEVSTDKEFLLIDMGTNCEFILSTERGMFAASVPAGPALEGAGIDYGSIAEDGAIEHVDFKGHFLCKTISNAKPTGIAGSGLISSIALLRRYGLIDETGRLLEAWEIEDAPLPLISRIKKEGFLLDGNIYLTPRSIREFQLAKAALNAGIEILLRKSGNSKLPENIYLSGGFTRSLTESELKDSGLLNIEANFIFLGNSALSGAAKLLCETNRKKLEDMAREIKYVEIAREKEFEKLFLEKINFQESN